MEKDYQLFSKYGNFLNYGIVKKSFDPTKITEAVDNVKKIVDDTTQNAVKEALQAKKGEDDEEELLTPDEIEKEESKEELNIELPNEDLELDEIEPEAQEPINETMSDIEEKFDEIDPKEVFENEKDIYELIDWLKENKFELDDSVFEMEEDNDEKKSFYIVYLDKKISENFPELEDKNIKVITVEEINDDLELKLWGQSPLLKRRGLRGNS